MTQIPLCIAPCTGPQGLANIPGCLEFGGLGRAWDAGQGEEQRGRLFFCLTKKCGSWTSSSTRFATASCPCQILQIWFKQTYKQDLAYWCLLHVMATHCEHCNVVVQDLPFKIPFTSRPPVNFTFTGWFKYLGSVSNKNCIAARNLTAFEGWAFPDPGLTLPLSFLAIALRLALQKVKRWKHHW